MRLQLNLLVLFALRDKKALQFRLSYLSVVSILVLRQTTTLKKLQLFKINQEQRAKKHRFKVFASSKWDHTLLEFVSSCNVVLRYGK